MIWRVAKINNTFFLNLGLEERPRDQRPKSPRKCQGGGGRGEGVAMHTLHSFLRLLCWRSRGVPIPPRESRTQLCLFLWACKCFGQDSKPRFGHIAVVFQSLHGTCPQISQRGDFADEELDIYFSLRWSFLFLDTCLTLRRFSEPYFRIDPKTLCVGFHRDCLPLWETNASDSRETQPNCGTIFKIATRSCRRFLFFCEKSSLSLAFCLVVHQPYDAGTHLSPALQPVSVL